MKLTTVDTTTMGITKTTKLDLLPGQACHGLRADFIVLTREDVSYLIGNPQYLSQLIKLFKPMQ